MNLKIKIFTLLLFAATSCFCQNNQFDIAISGLHSSVNKHNIGVNDSFYHYAFNPKFGASLDLYYNYPIKLIKDISIIGNLGIRSVAYEGKHYAGLVENSPEPEKLYRQYFWSTYRIQNLNANIGIAFTKKRFRISTLFESNFLLSANEKRQEVHLTDFYNSNLFFEEIKTDAIKLYNSTSIGYKFELDYYLFKNLYLNINYSLGINSIIKTSTYNLYYQTRVLGVGIKCINIVRNK